MIPSGKPKKYQNFRKRAFSLLIMREKYWLNAEDKKNEIKEHHLFQEKCSKEGPKRSPLRDRLQNTPKPSIPLVVNNVIPSTDWTTINCDHVSLGHGNPSVFVRHYGERTRTGYRAIQSVTLFGFIWRRSLMLFLSLLI